MMSCHKQYKLTRRIPGIIAPANKSIVEIGFDGILPWSNWDWLYAPWSTSLNNINTMDGGMICPNEPEAHINPEANILSYPHLSIVGKVKSPIVTEQI